MKTKKITNEKFLEIMYDFGDEARENIKGTLNAIVYILNNLENNNIEKILNEILNTFVGIKKDQFTGTYKIKAHFPEELANKIFEKEKETRSFVAKSLEIEEKKKQIAKLTKEVSKEELAQKYIKDLHRELIY